MDHQYRTQEAEGGVHALDGTYPLPHSVRHQPGAGVVQPHGAIHEEYSSLCYCLIQGAHVYQPLHVYHSKASSVGMKCGRTKNSS